MPAAMLHQLVQELDKVANGHGGSGSHWKGWNLREFLWRPAASVGRLGASERRRAGRSRSARRVRLAGCTVAALAAFFGLGPIVGPLVISNAAAATTNCSASVSGATALSRTGWTATSNTNSSPSDAPQNALDGNISTR